MKYIQCMVLTYKAQAAQEQDFIIEMDVAQAVAHSR